MSFGFDSALPHAGNRVMENQFAGHTRIDNEYSFPGYLLELAYSTNDFQEEPLLQEKGDYYKEGRMQPKDGRGRSRDAELDLWMPDSRPESRATKHLEGLLGDLITTRTTEDGGVERTFRDGTKITRWDGGIVRIEKPNGTGAVLTPSTYKNDEGRHEKYYRIKAWGPNPEDNYRLFRNTAKEFEILCDAKNLSPELKLLQSIRADQFTRLAAYTNEAHKR